MSSDQLPAVAVGSQDKQHSDPPWKARHTSTQSRGPDGAPNGQGSYMLLFDCSVCPSWLPTYAANSNDSWLPMKDTLVGEAVQALPSMICASADSTCVTTKPHGTRESLKTKH